MFGFGPKPEKGIKEADMFPGLSTMLSLGLRHQQKARPPPAEDLSKALQKFVHAKTKLKEPVNKLQAAYVLATFRHLRDLPKSEKVAESAIMKSNILVRAMSAMALRPDKGFSKSHTELASEVLDELNRRELPVEDRKAFYHSTVNYLTILTTTGHTEEAAKMLEFLLEEREMTFPKRSDDDILKLYNYILNGFAVEGKDANLIEAYERTQAHGFPLTRETQLEFIRLYTSQNNIPKSKEWFEKDVPLKSDKAPKYPSPEALILTMRFAVHNNELDWLNPIFKQIIQSNPYKQTWDVIFLWAAEVLGKGPEDVERMMDVMASHEEASHGYADMDTFNTLIASAVEANNPYLAERYISIAQNRGIAPNARTYIMQMQYRLKANDFSGAQMAYDRLRGEEVAGNIDLPVLNSFIRTLASAPNPDYDRIMHLVADISERDLLSHLYASTVSSLVVLHLKLGDIPEAINTLQSVVFHLDFEDRDSIRDAILSFISNPSNSTALAWDAYSVIRTIFPETDRSIRTKLMNYFFERRRSDMGCHVFGHMRGHEILDIRPDAETYVQCYLGIARCKDEESLRMVHNMMKMDVGVEPSTRLNNALMIAFASVGESDRALDFWIDITNSREGPSYRSLEIVFRVCEGLDFGESTAKEVWGMMRRMDVEVTAEVADAYVGALAGQVRKDEAFQLIDGMEKELGLVPSYLT